MSNKKQYVKFNSPRGRAKYPKTDRPYSWSNAQNKSVPDPDGQYELVVILSAEDSKVMIGKIDEAIKAEGIEPKNLPYQKVKDKDTKEFTGEYEFKFKAYGKDKDGAAKKLPFYDAKAKPVKGIKLTSGSVVKVSGWISVAKLGVRLNMSGVQVLSLVEYDNNPFTAEDGDFEADGFGEEDEDNNNDNASDEETESNTDF